MKPSRHPLVASASYLLPLTMVLAIGGVAAAHAVTGRLLAAWFALLAGAAWLWLKRQQPELLLDDDGWAIEQRGQEKLRVAWSEVKRARYDRREAAIYLDCGDPGRNLLVPPRRGFGFRFGGQEAICAVALAKLPAGVLEEVERLDQAAIAPPPDGERH